MLRNRPHLTLSQKPNVFHSYDHAGVTFELARSETAHISRSPRNQTLSTAMLVDKDSAVTAALCILQGKTLFLKPVITSWIESRRMALTKNEAISYTQCDTQ